MDASSTQYSTTVPFIAVRSTTKGAYAWNCKDKSPLSPVPAAVSDVPRLWNWRAWASTSLWPSWTSPTRRTAAEVKDLGRRVSVLPTDVTSRADLKTLAERTQAEFGRIDILVNNAGIYRAALPLDITEEHWDAVMNLNAKAVFFASQAVLPVMIAQKHGAIISLASMAAKVGSRSNLPYNASKATVVSITKSLALAHAADGIRVNCVCPGFVETDMWTAVASQQGALLGLSPEAFTQQRAAQVPLGRMERPEDVANVIGFLASPRASYMTGQAINVTGGLIMH
jgi:meso-butanediol dehydrogenase/(S,S)-butanediol dehydrogenase/diacetyl reductase